MIYAFNNNQLIYKGEKPIHSYEVPKNTYVYFEKSHWVVKYERQAYRPIKFKHLPNEIKLLCLIMEIPL